MCFLFIYKILFLPDAVQMMEPPVNSLPPLPVTNMAAPACLQAMKALKKNPAELKYTYKK
jgi:hypothetical protein